MLIVTMAFDELHSGADHLLYTETHHADVELTKTAEIIMMVLAVGTLILAFGAMCYIAKMEREEVAAKSR